MQLVEVLVLNGSFSSMWLASLGLFCLPCTLFLFLSLPRLLSSYRVWHGFITKKRKRRKKAEKVEGKVNENMEGE
jgi:hypothetical protein